MALDGLVVRAIVNELQELVGTRILKIYQPHDTDLILIIRGYGKNFNLLISANPTYPRIHLTNRNYTNPMEPPMFCMLLRKHLEGGIIEGITQIDNERIIHMDVKVRDELGDTQTRRLIIEIMGKHSNIILINPEKNLILDGINHVTAAISSYRQVLPGKEYLSPPQQDKVNPLLASEEQFFSLIKLNEGRIDKQIVDRFTGLSPVIAKEILHNSKLPTKENLWNAFSNLMVMMKENEYWPAIVSGEKTDFSIVPLTHLQGEITQFSSINSCLEEFYDRKADRDTIRQKTYDLGRFLINEKHKNEKKLENLLQDIDEAKKADDFKLYGELLTANLYQIKRGDKEALVPNYYTEEQTRIAIPLDPTRSPAENAQYYYKKYNKLKNSLNYIEEQQQLAINEILYLDSILTQLESANVEDINDIREELVEQGYLKERKRNQRKKNKNPIIEQYTSTEGITIYVGKNNKQNEYLTNKLASSSDTWLHTKDIPGSHVVIKAREFTEATLSEAAMLAAYYSKAKYSSQVPVDYTLIKYVKKPNGSKPGFVIYENQKTIFVTPDEKLVDQLKVKK